MRKFTYTHAGILQIRSFNVTSTGGFCPEAEAAKATVKLQRAQPVLDMRMLFSPGVLTIVW